MCSSYNDNVPGSLGARPSFSIFRGSSSETSYTISLVPTPRAHPGEKRYTCMMTQHFFGAQLLNVTLRVGSEDETSTGLE